MDKDRSGSRRGRSVETRDQDDSPMGGRWKGEYDDVEEDKSRESKHRSKEKSRSSRRDDKDNRSRDREKSKVNDGSKEAKSSVKDSSRDRRKEDGDDRDKDRTRDKTREKENDREKYREKDRPKEREKGLDKGKDKIREKEREKNKDRDKGKEDDKEYGIEVKDEVEMKFPFHILEMIMKFCVDVDNLNFRSTCKQFASLPVIRWKNITTIPRLKTYPLVSPWLMVLDKDRGLIKITDPMLGDKYFIKIPQHFTGELQIHCSRYGWLLMSKNTTGVMFYNPFTGDIRTLPHLYFFYIKSFSFSAPPTSPDCMVVGLTTIGEWTIYIHSVNRDQLWHRLQINFDDYSPSSFCFPTFFGRDIYVLNDGGLDVYTHTKNGDENENYKWDIVVVQNPNENNFDKPSRKYYLTKSDEYLLLVFVDLFKKSVEVYKLNRSTNQWENIDSLGRYTIYACDSTCLCFEAKTSKMENMIYFHQSYSNIVFYSLETHEFHTCNEDMERSFGDLFKPKKLLQPHVWIEPSCS